MWAFDVGTGFLIRLFWKRKEKIPHEIVTLKTRHQTNSNLRPSDQWSNAVPLSQQPQLLNQPQIFAIYPITLLMYTVAIPGPNLGGGGQVPNPNECNSTLTSGTRRIYRYLHMDEEPVPVQNSFLKRISAISVQSDGLRLWRCLAFLKRQLHFTVFGKYRSLHFPRYASLDHAYSIQST